jgi:hypothetical protein
MIERWNPAEHMPLLGKWLVARGLTTGAGWEELYPATGFVVDGCAIGFLYRTDAPHVGWLDGIVSDPDVPKTVRGPALYVLCKELYAEAERQGLRLVWATTAAPTLVAIGGELGAQVFGRDHVCLSWTPR